MHIDRTPAAVSSERETFLFLMFVFTWQRFMGAQLPYGNNEGMQPLALALSVELSQNNGVVRRLSHCRSGSRKGGKK